MSEAADPRDRRITQLRNMLVASRSRNAQLGNLNEDLRQRLLARLEAESRENLARLREENNRLGSENERLKERLTDLYHMLHARNDPVLQIDILKDEVVHLHRRLRLLQGRAA